MECTKTSSYYIWINCNYGEIELRGLIVFVNLRPHSSLSKIQTSSQLQPTHHQLWQLRRDLPATAPPPPLYLPSSPSHEPPIGWRWTFQLNPPKLEQVAWAEERLGGCARPQWRHWAVCSAGFSEVARTPESRPGSSMQTPWHSSIKWSLRFRLSPIPN